MDLETMEIRVVRITMAGLKTLRTEEVICQDSNGKIQTPNAKKDGAPEVFGRGAVEHM